MARARDAEQFLRQGLYPSQIAEEMGITTATVIGYLRARVGTGSLRFSEIYFSFPEEKREQLQQMVETSTNYDTSKLRDRALTREELKLFKELRESSTFDGDMYEHVSRAELAIHMLVRATVESRYGQDAWWREGVPLKIRKSCACRLEEDEEPCTSPYSYTHITDLSDIIKSNWNIFQRVVPEKYRPNKKLLESDFRRLNKIRNAVMHPVKQRRWYEVDFVFARELRREFHVACQDS